MLLSPDNTDGRKTKQLARTRHCRHVIGIGTTKGEQLLVARCSGPNEIVFKFAPFVATKGEVIRRMQKIIPLDEYLYAI